MTTYTINDIESLSKAFSSARAELSERLTVLRDEVEEAKRRRLQGIRNSASRLQAAHADLHAAIQASPQLFEQPKTRVMHGIRLGWMKQRGKLEFQDPEALCTAIRRFYGDDADTLIQVREAPIRSALANLPARDLQKLGVTVTEDTDAVVIKPADADLDKLLAALLDNRELEDLKL